MLCQLVDRVEKEIHKGSIDPSGIEIQIYEKQDVFGPGFPHSDKFVLPFHITNMCASDMGILDGKPKDFHEWVLDNSESLKIRFSWFRDFSSSSKDSPEECHHYPRAIMGEYLKSRFQEALQFARQVGLSVRLYPNSEVIDMQQNGGPIGLRVKNVNSESFVARKADRVLLATGHWFAKTDQDRYFTSPWPAKKLLSSIPKGAKVAVIGTSLSAIETLLTLTSEGRFIRSHGGELVYEPAENSRKLYLYSRRGLLPKVRGTMGKYRNAFLNRENLDHLISITHGNLTLEAVFQMLNSELEEAYGREINWAEIINPTAKPADLMQEYLDAAVNGDGPYGELMWQTILNQSIDMVKDIYLNLKVGDRKRFDKNYTSVFFSHAASQPSINAEKMLALMKAGLVEVIKLGKDYRLIRNETDDVFEFIYTDNRGSLKRDAYRYVVNARGQEKSLETNPSTLARNLIKSGIVQITEISSIRQSNDSHNDLGQAQLHTGDTYKTGSIWIDPATHRIIELGPENKIKASNAIYAVGAMTRGQIINASMVNGIVQATSRIADDLLNFLKRTGTQPGEAGNE